MKQTTTFLFFFIISILLSVPSIASLRVIQKDTPFTSSYVFVRNDGQTHPGIVILHGSGGGSLTNMWVNAMALADSGFSVMTYCWFDCGRDVRSGLVPLLADIELNETVKAMSWFKNSEYLSRHSKLGLYGVSMGAEQAIILASLQAQLPFSIDALAVHAPSDIVDHGFNNGWLDKRCWICRAGEKQCQFNIERWNPSCGKMSGEHQDPDSLQAWLWHGVALTPGSRIEVEKYKGPVFVTCGEKDEVWGAERTRRIQASLESKGLRPEVHIFPNEGHSFTTAAEQRRKSLVDDFFRHTLK
jgi:dienelactone hydrolase